LIKECSVNFPRSDAILGPANQSPRSPPAIDESHSKVTSPMRTTNFVPHTRENCGNCRSISAIRNPGSCSTKPRLWRTSRSRVNEPLTSASYHFFSSIVFRCADKPAPLNMAASSSQEGSLRSNGGSIGKAFRNKDLDGHNLPPSPAPSSPRNGRKYALATELVYTESSDQYNASSMPIYQVRQIGEAECSRSLLAVDIVVADIVPSVRHIQTIALRRRRGV
jgi:hypothetical protein